MGRVINTDGPGKRRNYHMRTGAEILRRLTEKPEVDKDTKDMVAQLVLSLREINDTIDESARAWEKRDYWMKAEEFRRRWDWAAQSAVELENLVQDNAWDTMPAVMIKLLPKFAEIKVVKYTRPETTWQGAYRHLSKEFRNSAADD